MYENSIIMYGQTQIFPYIDYQRILKSKDSKNQYLC